MMNQSEVEPRIYVADLAAYNAGKLHGTWIDLEFKDEDEIGEEIAELLRKSPCPNVEIDCPSCEGDDPEDCATCKGSGTVPSAEEFAIHDHEGLGDLVGEYSSISEIVELAQLISDHGDMARAAIDCSVSIEEAKERIETFQSCGDSLEDLAMEYSEGCGDLPDHWASYIDWKAYARDLFMDCTTHRYDGRVYVFGY